MTNIIEFKEDSKVKTLQSAVIDIEAISTNTNALILSIGLILFDYKTFENNPDYIKENCNTYLWNIDSVAAQRDYNLDISMDTVKFWIDETEKNPGIFPGQGDSELLKLDTVLRAMLDACRPIQRNYMPGHDVALNSYWSHSNFDHKILKNSCDKVGLEYFPHRECRDLRTLEFVGNMFGISRKQAKYKPIVLHNALSDAIAEAGFVSDVLRALDLKT